MNEQQKSPLASFILIILIFIIGWQSSLYYYNTFGKNEYKGTNKQENQIDAKKENEEISANDVDLKLLFAVWQKLREGYVDEKAFDNQKQIYGAIHGLVESLNDPYTVFMTPEESKEFQASLDGKLEGIGAELTVEDKNLVVVSPLKGSPAERAGLQPGDIIYKINDDIAAEMSLFEAIMKIRGEKGSKVNLTVFRKGGSEPIKLIIERDSISLASVSWEKKDDDIAYVSINQFSDNTKTEFQKAVSELLLTKPKGVILDLRYNGGGYLDIAVDIVGEFIDGKKKAVTIKQRDDKKNESIFSNGTGRLTEVPLVVLVNNGSASASEIVAGAIQDYKRGIIMGEQTFGKGSVQEVESLEDGSSLRVTIAKWFTPNERTIDHLGITPDRVIEFTEEDSKNKKDPQLEAAIQYLKSL
ncbi:S41 family peptidase [Candidatus Peregrinibacteria bacterium]|nr:S41 family peptidase [Candidatus Peregrinibacteria bacterium]